jgi:hypothetical protein
VHIKEEIDDEPSKKEGSESGNVSSSENDAKMKEDVKQGIMFLENAMAEKEEAQEPKSRKPLADIGSNAVSTISGNNELSQPISFRCHEHLYCPAHSACITQSLSGETKRAKTKAEEKLAQVDNTTRPYRASSTALCTG